MHNRTKLQTIESSDKYKVRKVVLLLLLFLVMASEAYSNNYDFVVVDGIVTLDASALHKDPRVYPWEDIASEEREQGEILVANSCGLINVIYRGYDLKNYIKLRGSKARRINVVINVGEFCNISDYIFEENEPTLLVIKKWGKKKYLVDYFNFYEGFNGDYFVSSKAFISNAGIEDKIKVTFNSNYVDGACIGTRDFSEEKINTIASRSYLKVISNDIACYEKGVYLKDFISLYLNDEIVYEDNL